MRKNVDSDFFLSAEFQSSEEEEEEVLALNTKSKSRNQTQDAKKKHSVRTKWWSTTQGEQTKHVKTNVSKLTPKWPLLLLLLSSPRFLAKNWNLNLKSRALKKEKKKTRLYSKWYTAKKDTKESRIQSVRESRGREDLQERKVFREFVIPREKHTGFYNGTKWEFFAARRRGEEERQQHGGGENNRDKKTRSTDEIHIKKKDTKSRCRKFSDLLFNQSTLPSSEPVPGLHFPTCQLAIGTEEGGVIISYFL